MSFLDKVKAFFGGGKSRLGDLLGAVGYIVRDRYDTNKNGKIDPDEVLQAIPTSVTVAFPPAKLLKWVPVLIEAYADLQGSLPKKD
jgi:hypothetical protein